MPISDQVIELETKKKGRTVLFIILIAVFAAAAVAFAVLWITKEGATAKPSIEKISMASTDLSQISGAAGSEEEIKYTVSPGCSYSVDFDIVLKEGTAAEDVNSILTFSTDPPGYIAQLTGSGLDTENPTRYVFKFKVSDNASGTFKLIITSKFSPEVSETFLLSVDGNSHTDCFDVADNQAGVKVLSEYQGSGGEALLSYDESKSSETSRFYSFEEPLPFYESPLAQKNNMYIINFEQLGKLGLNGVRAKVMANATGDGNYTDQIKIMVAKGWDNLTDASFKEVNDSSRQSDYLSFYFGYGGENYCHSLMIFQPTSAGKSTVKFIANAYNSADTQYEVIMQIEFVSSNELDKITEIIFTNPYTGVKSTEVDLYLDDFESGNPFRVSDFITVKRGSKDPEAAVWGTGKLLGRITNSSGGNTSRSLIATLQGISDFVIYPTSSTEVGTAYVTVSNTEPGNLATPLIIKVNIRASIGVLGVGASASENASVSVYSGDDCSAQARYTVKGSTVKAIDVADSLNSYLTISYPDELTKPKVTETNGVYRVTNPNETISIEGIKTSGAQYYVEPSLKEIAIDQRGLLGDIKFKVGADVLTGDYVLTFTLPFQKLTYNGNADDFDEENDELYTASGSMSFTVTVKVTRLATSFAFGNINTDNFDKEGYECFMDKENHKATLTLAIGSGTLVNGYNYTDFTLRDLLAFFEDDEPVTDADKLNYNELVIVNEKGGSTTSIIYTADKTSDLYRKFVVPSRSAADSILSISLKDFKVTLTIEYKYAVTGVEISISDDKPANIYYEAPETTGTSIGNGKVSNAEGYDNVSAISSSGSIDSNLNMKYPEKLQLDIAYVVGNSALVFPKKVLEGSSHFVYYFRPGETVFTTATAVFRTNNSGAGTSDDILSSYNVRLFRDLYSLSYELGDCQNIRIYYSYGDVIDVQSGYAVIKDEKFVKYSDYNFVRRFDDFAIYENDSYSEDISGENISLTSGSTFKIYYSGIIVDEKGTSHIVNAENKAFACSGVSAPEYNTSIPNNLMYDSSKGEFTVRSEPFDGELSCGIIKYNEDGTNKNAYVSISVNNTAVQIDEIKFYSDASQNEPIDNDVQTLYTNSTPNRIRIYYTVKYVSYDDGNTSLDVFSFETPNGFKEVNRSQLPNFNTPPVSLNPIEIKDGTGLTLTNKVWTYYGYVVYDVNSGATNGTRPFTITPTGNGEKAESISLRITTLLKGVTAFNSDTNKTLDSSSSSVKPDVRFTYDESKEYSDGSNSLNSRLFDFAFATQVATAIDYANLTYSVQITGQGSSKLAVIFYDNLGNDLSAPDGKNVKGFRVVFDKYRVDGATLTVKITDTETGDEFTLSATLSVDIPVNADNLKLTIGDERLDKDNDTFSVTTSGIAADGKQAFALGTAVNGSVDYLQPISVNDSYTLGGVPESLSNDVYVNAAEKTLYVNNTLLSGNYTLTLDVNGVSLTVKINIVTTKKAIVFDNYSGSLSVSTRNPIDLSATVSNAGSGETNAECEVTYTYDSSKFDKNGNLFTPKLSSFTGTITASCTYNYNYGNAVKSDTVSVVIDITVLVPVDYIEVKQGESTFGNTLVLVAGEKVTLIAAARSNTGVTPAETEVTISGANANDLVATVTDKGNNEFELLAKAKGQTSFTLMAGGIEKEITVSVLGANLSLAAPSYVLDIFSGESITFTLSLSLNDYADRASELYGVADLGNTVSAGVYDSFDKSLVSGGGKLFAVSVAGDKITVTLNKDKLTSADLDKSYYVEVTASLKGAGLVASKTLDLSAEYAPELAFSHESGEINRADVSTGNYGFTLENALDVSSFDSALAAYEVKFASDDFGFAENANTATVTSITNDGAISGAMKVTVTIFGKTFTKSVTVTIADTRTISSALTYNNAAIAGDFDVGYSADANRKVIKLSVNLANAPQAVKSAPAANFTVTLEGDTTAVVYKSSAKTSDAYTVEYYAVNVGNVSFAVKVFGVDGKTYTANTVNAKFIATEANLQFDVNRISLKPGESTAKYEIYNAAAESADNPFAGVIDYEYTLTGDSKNIITLTDERNGAFKLSAKTGLGGCNAILSIRATVTSGVYKNYSYYFTVPVEVAEFAAPVFEVSDAWINDGRSLTLSDLITVTRDDSDYNCTYAIVYGGDNSYNPINSSNGVISDGIYTPAVTSGGLNFRVYYKITVTGGYYAAEDTIYDSGSFVIAVAPVATLTGSDSVLCGDTVNLTLSVPNGTIKNATYKLSNNAAGTVVKTANGCAFTAAQGFSGSVVITAEPEIEYGGLKGLCAEVTATVSVTRPELKVARSVADNKVRTYTVTSDYNGAEFGYEASGEDLITVTESGTKEFTVTPKADTFGGEVIFKVIMTLYGIEYEYIDTFNVTAADVPALIASLNGSKIQTSISDGSSANYSFGTESEYIILYADGSFTFKNGASGVIAVTVKATLTSGLYIGRELTETVNIRVSDYSVPELPALNVTAADGKITVSEGYVIDVDNSGSDKVTISYSVADGYTYTFDSSVAEGETVSFTLALKVSGGYFDGYAVNYNVSVTKPITSHELPALNVTASDGKITVSEGYVIDTANSGNAKVTVSYSVADGYTYAFDSSVAEGETVSFTLALKVSGGYYDGYAVNYTVSVTKPVTPPAVPDEPIVSAERAGNSLTVTVTSQEDGVNYEAISRYSSDYEFITVYADGSFAITEGAQSGDTVIVNVKVVLIGDGYYGGKTYDKPITFVLTADDIPAAEPNPDVPVTNPDSPENPDENSGTDNGGETEKTE